MGKSPRLTRRAALGRFAAGAVGAAALRARGDESTTTQPARDGALRQSICQWCYNRKLSTEQLAEHAARIGYASIELIGPAVWPIVKKYGLTCAMAPGAGTTVKGFSQKKHHAELIAEMHRNLDLAADAGLPNVICFSGNREGLTDDEGIRNCVDAIKQVVSHAEKRKINICMEILNSKVDHKDYQFDHMPFGIEIVRKVGSPRFGILYDIYHAQIMEGDIIRTIRDHHEMIFHYHTGGNPGRNEIDETQELNYVAIVEAIVRTGFRGYIAQEFIPKRDPVAGLERAFAICSVPAA